MAVSIVQQAFMRFNQTIFVAFSATLLSLAAASSQLQAREHHSVSTPQSDSKNDGRKLSMTLPGLGTAVVTVTPSPSPLKLPAIGKPLAPGRHLSFGQPGFEKKDLSIETRGNNITVRVPPSVDAAIDDAQVVSRQLGKMASNGMAGANRIFNMIVLYIKQWTGSGTITPGGYPYIEKSSPVHAMNMQPLEAAADHQLYFTGEGRLKTVVSR
jgi:hypothetical protein